MRFAWNAYREKAWGFDEVMPRSGNSNNHWSGVVDRTISVELALRVSPSSNVCGKAQARELKAVCVWFVCGLCVFVCVWQVWV